MRLAWKDEETFQRIKEIVDECFTGLEHPPEGILREKYDHGDVFIYWTGSEGRTTFLGFAIVIDLNGGLRLWNIAVTRSAQGAGIGAALLQEITNYYTKAGRSSITLNCKVDNPAQKLYFDHGFRVEKVAKNYYGPEGDGLFMRRTLC